MEHNELKPCPFCGGEPYAEIDYDHKEFKIYCLGGNPCNCLAEMRLSFADAQLGDGSVISFDEAIKIMNELIELWNARNEEDEDDEE